MYISIYLYINYIRDFIVEQIESNGREHKV